MKHALRSALLLALLAGLPAAAAPPRAAGPDVEHLRRMNDAYRNLAFRNTIRDGGFRCARVLASGYQEDFNKLSMWTARCAGTGDFAILIAANGYAQVHPCSQAGLFAIPRCRMGATAH